MDENITHNIDISIAHLDTQETEQEVLDGVVKSATSYIKEAEIKEAAKQIGQDFIAAQSTVPTKGGVTGIATISTSNTTPLVSAGNASLTSVQSTSAGGNTSTGMSSGNGQSATSNTMSPAGGGVTDITTTSISNTTSPASDGSGNQVLPPAVATTTKLYAGMQTSQITVPQNVQGGTSTTPTLEEVKTYVEGEYRNSEDVSKKSYWGGLSKKLSEGVSIEDILTEDREGVYGVSLLSDWYDSKGTFYENELCLDWTIIKPQLLNKLKYLQGKDASLNIYYSGLISRVNNATDISRLFQDHDELFIILNHLIPEGIPATIQITYNNHVYPDLSPQKLYADIGIEDIYYVWSGNYLDLVIVNATQYRFGEIETTKDNPKPPRKHGQWYDYDRKRYATKSGSSFWEAAIYNTENGFAYLYRTIAQRNAYYKFADAYLNSKGILSEWYAAAVRVTMNSPILGEVAVGAAGKNSINLWFLNDETEKFLRDGNKFLFPENMNNVKLLLEGKGKINMTFTDVNGVEQSFEGLTQKELDFKLVEFEQSLVGEYLKEYLDENRREGVLRDWNEIWNNTAEQDLEDIIKQINKNFNSFMAEDLTQDIMREHFTKEGRIVFDFSKYEDRVKLGQVMVEELYYKRSKDIFKKENFDKILENPDTYKNTIFSYEELVYDKKLIPAKNPSKLKEYYLELLEDYKRLEAIVKDDERLVQVMKEIGHILEDIGKAVGEELSSMYQETEDYILNKIEDYQEKVLYILEHPIDYVSEEVTDQVYSAGILLTDPLRFIEEYFSGGPIIVKRRNLRNNKWKKVTQKEQQGWIAEKRDKVAANALVNTAKRIYPEVEMLVAERSKQNIFEGKGTYKKTVAILLYEYAMGEGKAIRDFGYSTHDFATKILTDRVQKEILDKTLELLERTDYDFVTIPDSIVLRPALPFSPSPGIFVESIDKHLNSNLAQLFMGGAIVYVRIKNGNIVGYIENKTTKNSLFLHMGVDNDDRNDEGMQKRLSTITQRIHFSFKLPSKYDA
ncbi:MAG: hypothetical protein ACI9Y7_000252 [Dokdonia sp.]|jgi:hypothetical protein